MDAVADVGTMAPDFRLESVGGETYRLQDARGSLLVLSFWSTECPWAKKGDEAFKALDVDWGEDALLWRIASNEDEGAEEMRKVAQERGVGPVLRDDGHVVADLYGAVTTPHVYVIDREGVLRYKGAPNDAAFDDPEPNRNYLAEALEAADRGESPDPAVTDGRGCTIVRHG